MGYQDYLHKPFSSNQDTVSYQTTTMSQEIPLITTDDLKQVLVTQATEYTQRIVLLCSENQDSLKGFIEGISAEFVKQCTNRKFTILNINVVRANQERILKDDRLRTFYFELHKSVEFVLAMDWKISIHDLIDEYIKTLSNAPASFYPDKRKDSLNIHINGTEYEKMCAGMIVSVESIQEFLHYNPWYFIFILVNMYAPALFESIQILISQEH